MTHPLHQVKSPLLRAVSKPLLLVLCQRLMTTYASYPLIPEGGEMPGGNRGENCQWQP